MLSDSYRFTLGRFQGLIVTDGTLVVPPPPDLPAVQPDGQPAGEKMDVLNLYLDSGDRHILIDTGCGSRFGGDTGFMVENLKANGVVCEDIDTVIFTHGHLDHVAGTFTADGQPVFPNARYIVMRLEWQCWVDRSERPEVSAMFTPARRQLLPLADRFHLSEEGEEVLPGIVMNAAPGHTPGGALIRVSSQGKSLVCIGDLVHSATEFQRWDYYAFLDTHPDVAVRTRQAVLGRLAESGETVFACHFPFPGLGWLVKAGDSVAWETVRL